MDLIGALGARGRVLVRHEVSGCRGDGVTRVDCVSRRRARKGCGSLRVITRLV